MNRGRINVAAHVPETGASKVSANVVVIWDQDSSLADQEAAIQAAALAATSRVREVAAGTARAALVSTGQLTLFPAP